MQINQSIIDEIISRADIIDVVSKNIKLKRSGQNYLACCPFHKEKTPSFSVNSVKQFFHCFGCEESGDVISFVMKFNGVDFIDAIKILADTYGVHIPESNEIFTPKQLQQKKEHKATLKDTINKTVQFFRNNLVNSNIAKDYLLNRGLTNEVINQFLIGFAPNDFNLLEKLFPDYAKNPFLIDSGLVIKNEANKIYDRFRGRIIFPIRNTKGDVIAFGGRVINNSEPKYLNSPETVLFNKSQELYGLFEGQKSIRSKNQVIIVEGYMDVIALNQFGINNVVATMGTAITDEHIKKLFRLCDNIYYAFDGDNAGRKAAWRALERSIANITDTKASYFLFFPKEHDPDSFIRNKGANEFINQLNNNSVPLSSFLLNQLSSEVNINTEEGKARLISLAKPFLEQTKAIALQVILKKQLAKIVELEPNVLESILNNRSRYAFYNNQWKNNSQLPVKENIIKINLVEIIIRHALHNISWVIKYKLPENINFHSQEIQELALIIDFIHNNYNINDNIELIKITEYVNSHTLNLENIYNNNNIINLTEEEFRQTLDNLFGLSARKVVKIPKIPMKEQSNE